MVRTIRGDLCFVGVKSACAAMSLVARLGLQKRSSLTKASFPADGNYAWLNVCALHLSHWKRSQTNKTKMPWVILSLLFFPIGVGNPNDIEYWSNPPGRTLIIHSSTCTQPIINTVRKRSSTPCHCRPRSRRSFTRWGRIIEYPSVLYWRQSGIAGYSYYCFGSQFVIRWIGGFASYLGKI